MGSEAVIDATVVRDTLPRASDQLFGRGISIQGCGTQGVSDGGIGTSDAGLIVICQTHIDFRQQTVLQRESRIRVNRVEGAAQEQTGGCQ